MRHVWESWPLYSRDRRRRLVVSTIVRCRRCGADQATAPRSCKTEPRR